MYVKTFTVDDLFLSNEERLLYDKWKQETFDRTKGVIYHTKEQEKIADHICRVLQKENEDFFFHRSKPCEVQFFKRNKTLELAIDRGYIIKITREKLESFGIIEGKDLEQGVLFLRFYHSRPHSDNLLIFKTGNRTFSIKELEKWDMVKEEYVDFT